MRSIIGAGNQNHINGGPDSGILSGYANTIGITRASIIVGGECNCINSPYGSFNTYSDYGFIGAGINNTISASACSAIVGGANNSICNNLDNTFIVGSNLTASRACTTFMNSTDISGSLDLNLSQIPTSSLGLRTGQVYRTGSAFDDLKIKL